MTRIILRIKLLIEYGVIGEGSQILANQKRESTVISLLIGLNLRPFSKNTVPFKDINELILIFVRSYLVPAYGIVMLYHLKESKSLLQPCSSVISR